MKNKNILVETVLRKEQNANMYMKSLFSQNLRDNIPSIPLPNPGEGGAVAPGNNDMMLPDMSTDNTTNVPVTPLPNPGEGGPVQNGPTESGNNQPVTPLPSPGEGGAVFPGNGTMNGGTTTPGTTNGTRPVIPLPNVGEGGAVFPGTGGMGTGIGTGNGTGLRPGLTIPAIIGTIITTFPRPNAPCRFCANQNQTYGNVRFLNVASDYNPFRVYVNDQLFVASLNFEEVTSYEKVPSNYQIVTVMGENQYIYIQKPIMVPRDGYITVAICNTENGLDLFVVNDSSCSKSDYVSCVRVCNLSFNSGPLSVVVGNNDLQFLNVAFQEITNYKIITPADYIFYVINGNRNILLSTPINIKVDASYTIYLFNWNISSPDTITALIVEER